MGSSAGLKYEKILSFWSGKWKIAAKIKDNIISTPLSLKLDFELKFEFVKKPKKIFCEKIGKIFSSAECQTKFFGQKSGSKIKIWKLN